MATSGTARVLEENGIAAKKVFKIEEGRPNVADLLKNGEIKLVINTPSGKDPLKDEIVIRQAALSLNVPVITTVAGACATVQALEKYLHQKIEVKPLQDYTP